MVDITTNPETGDAQRTKEFVVEVTRTVTVAASDEAAAKSEVGSAVSHSGEKRVVDSNEIGEVEPPCVRVRFHPQAWHRDYARETDAEGRAEFRIPLSDAVNREGELVEDNSGESDALKRHERVPLWIKEWDGPFRVTLEEVCLGEAHDSLDDALEKVQREMAE